MQLSDVNLNDLDAFEHDVPHEMFEVLRREAPVHWHEAALADVQKHSPVIEDDLGAGRKQGQQSVDFSQPGIGAGRGDQREPVAAVSTELEHG